MDTFNCHYQFSSTAMCKHPLLLRITRHPKLALPLWKKTSIVMTVPTSNKAEAAFTREPLESDAPRLGVFATV